MRYSQVDIVNWIIYCPGLALNPPSLTFLWLVMHSGEERLYDEPIERLPRRLSSTSQIRDIIISSKHLNCLKGSCCSGVLLYANNWTLDTNYENRIGGGKNRDA